MVLPVHVSQSTAQICWDSCGGPAKVPVIAFSLHLKIPIPALIDALACFTQGSPGDQGPAALPKSTPSLDRARARGDSLDLCVGIGKPPGLAVAHPASKAATPDMWLSAGKPQGLPAVETGTTWEELPLQTPLNLGVSPPTGNWAGIRALPSDQGTQDADEELHEDSSSRSSSRSAGDEELDEEFRNLDSQMTREGKWPTQQWVLRVAVPRASHGLINGSEGSTKWSMEVESGATIQVPSIEAPDDCIWLRGRHKQQIYRAKAQVEQLCKKEESKEAGSCAIQSEQASQPVVSAGPAPCEPGGGTASGYASSTSTGSAPTSASKPLHSPIRISGTVSRSKPNPYQ